MSVAGSDRLLQISSSPYPQSEQYITETTPPLSPSHIQYPMYKISCQRYFQIYIYSNDPFPPVPFSTIIPYVQNMYKICGSCSYFTQDLSQNKLAMPFFFKHSSICSFSLSFLQMLGSIVTLFKPSRMNPMRSHDCC